jgi:HD-GYP domain-containing protein (c-di-GMP phosphodiesterase class II)
MAEDSKTKPLTASPDDLLRTIFSYVGRIADERDIDQLLILLADMGRDLISADRCTVWLLNRKTEELWSKVAHGVDRITIPCSAGIAGCVAMTGESLIINDPYNDDRFDKDVDKKTGYHTRNILGLPINDGEGKIIGVYQAINKMPEPENFSEQDLEHLLLAATYTGKALDAAMLQEEIDATQREIIFKLAAAGEMRSKETDNHVKRVAEFCRLLAEKYGMSAEEVELFKRAAPMHDIGKIAIPDSILLKPGKLTPEEWDTMKTHTTLGFDLLKDSERQLLKAAAIVAHEHHEKWNGEGYPNGKKGEDIHLYGRITAMADVFDALGNARVYKPAWELDRIVKLFKAEKGHQFDPKLVKVFLDNLDRFVKIKETYKDGPPATKG